MSDSYAKVVQGSATGTALPITGTGAGGLVNVYSQSSLAPIFNTPVDSDGSIIWPPGALVGQTSLLANVTKTTNFQYGAIRSYGARGILYNYVVTGVTGGPGTWTISALMVDSFNSIVITLVTSAPQAGAASGYIFSYPGIAAAANVSANSPIGLYGSFSLTLSGLASITGVFVTAFLLY